MLLEVPLTWPCLAQKLVSGPVLAKHDTTSRSMAMTLLA